MQISIVVVHAGPIGDLSATLQSIYKSDFRGLDVEVIVQTTASLDTLAELDHSVDSKVEVKTESRKDNGIYHGMNLALSRISSKQGYVWFLNSGDLAKAFDLIVAEDATSVFYSDVYCEKKIIKSRIIPWLLKMPNHQGMLIPKSVFHDLGYRFPSTLNVSGDLDLKMYLRRNNLSYVKMKKPISEVDRSGISGSMNMRVFVSRLREMQLIALSYLGFSMLLVNSIVYVLWFGFRLILKSKFTK